jgi:peptidoglycan/LPS O-acetylase OafA/YrhL
MIFALTVNMSVNMSVATLTQTEGVARSARTRLAYLDGIRGLAALFVVAHHLWREYTRGSLPGLKGIITNWLLYGHLAVDVFIVLSGFCLMLPVSRSGALRGGWQTFYKSRARRILPPLYAAVALGIAANIVKGVPPSKEVILANLLLLQDLLPQTNVLDGPLWSVALEWKIYFLFPLFVWLWSRWGLPWVLFISAVIGYALTILLLACSPAVYLALDCPWYVFLFGMGMAATDLALRRDQGSLTQLFSWLLPCCFLGALACLAAVLFKWPITASGEQQVYVPHLPIIDTITGVVTALALVILSHLAARSTPSPIIRLLSWKPLVFAGTIGYSIYLVHGIIIYKVKAMLIAHLRVHPAIVVILLDMAIIICFSYIFHLIVERPFMSKPGKLAPKTEQQAEVAAIESPAP